MIELTRRHGPLQPVLVRPLGKRRYQILANIESWLAAQACGFREVPIEVVDDLDEDGALGILEATERRPRPLDTVRRWGRLVEAERSVRSWGALARVARECGVAPSRVARALRVLTLSPVILKAVDVGALSVGHAYALLACRDEERRFELGTRAIDERLSVRALEEAVRVADTAQADASVGSVPCTRSPDVERLERRLTGHLGSEVTIDETSGTLTIDYLGSLEVLQGVLDRIGYRE